MKRKEAKIAFSVHFAVSHHRNSAHPAVRMAAQAPPRGTTLSMKPHSFELCLGACVLYLDLLCASTGKMCRKLSEKLERACKGVVLTKKRHN